MYYCYCPWDLENGALVLNLTEKLGIYNGVGPQVVEMWGCKTISGALWLPTTCGKRYLWDWHCINAADILAEFRCLDILGLVKDPSVNLGTASPCVLLTCLLIPHAPNKAQVNRGEEKRKVGNDCSKKQVRSSVRSGSTLSPERQQKFLEALNQETKLKFLYQRLSCPGRKYITLTLTI